MKIQICHPTRAYPVDWFRRCMVPLLNRLEQEGIQYEMAEEGGGSIPLACEKLMGCDFGQPLEEAKVPEGFDRFFWIHTDIFFTWDAFARVMDTLDDGKDIAGGLYLKNAAGFFATHRLGDRQSLHVDDIKGLSDPFEVAHPCGGFHCVKREVYERMRRPFFANAPMKIKGKWFLVDEDVWFGYKAREESGFRSWVHPLAIVGHYKTSIMAPKDEQAASVW